MALVIGSRLGPYDILAALGAGGMGEVYRARDTRLKRDVALKILPQSFGTDSERLARFQREAEVLASLNHPNIAQIYGLEESTSVHALVMELVDGPTLADRLAQGPIPLDEVLPIARQVCEALEAAHEQGIIHRDLKPANVKVRPDGTVKVLDFGLAKLAESPSATRPTDMTASPTITSPAMMTGIGVLLGTAAYMSPEQAKGREADKRSDIWAFGCVLFEMVSGTRAFAGDDLSDTLAAVLRGDPDWSALPSETPARIQQAVRVCLQRNPKQRIAHVQDVRLALEGVFAFEDHRRARSEFRMVSSTRRRVAVVAAAALVGAMGVAVWSTAVTRRSITGDSRPSPVRFAIPPPENTTFGGPASGGTGSATQVALSPDGRTIVFVAGARSSYRIWQRPIAALEATPIAGTEGGAFPFWSPDSQSIGFFAGGKLKKIQVSGAHPPSSAMRPAAAAAAGATVM